MFKITVDQLLLICYNIDMNCTNTPEFELPKTNVFGNSNIAKVVDQLIIFCYTNGMLKTQHIFNFNLGSLKGIYHGSN
jgi:hypothetical protein